MGDLSEVIAILEGADFYDDLHDITEFRDRGFSEIESHRPLGNCTTIFSSLEDLEEYEKRSLEVSDEQLHNTLDYISGVFYK